MELSFQLIFLKYISMFFQSLIKKKQSLFTPSSPRYDSIAERKEIHINNFTHKNDKQNAQDNGVSINRSKSQKGLNENNYFIAQLKRPIIPKDHSTIKQVGVGANQQLQKHLRQQKEYNICKNKINSCDKVLRTESNTSKGGQNQRLLDMNQYQMRNSFRQISNNSHHKNINNKQSRDSGIKNFQNFQPFHCSQFSTGRKIDVYDYNEQNQSMRMKSPMSCTFPAQFNIDKAFNEYFQEQTTKMSQKQYQNGDLRLMIKNLQRQLQFMARQRDIDKGKLLQSSIMIDKLKFQNECIKKSYYKSKENIDGKGKNGNQLGQLRRVLRQQLQQKQNLQKQRKNILSQLNQTLQNFEREKSRWQKQKMATEHKLDILLKQIRQKKAQNIQLAQKSNRVCNENKKLRETKLLLQKQLQQKQNQVKWMNSKVNDLKQALEYFKEHGNTKIKKLQQEISHSQVMKKDIVTTEVRQLQNKLLEKQVLIQQLREEIEQHNSTINSFKQEVRTLSSSLQSKDKNIFSDQMQRLSMEIAEAGKQNSQLKTRLDKQVALQQDVVMQKNKVIQALAKNVSDVNIQIEIIKREKIVSEKERQQLKSQLQQLKIQVNKNKEQQNKRIVQNNTYISRIGELQNKLTQKQNSIRLITSKLQQKQTQIVNINKQLEKYKQLYSSKYEESRAKQQKIKYYQNKQAQVNKQLQNANKNIIELNKILQIKQHGNGNAQKQIQKVRIQMCQIFEKLQYANKQLDAKQKLLQSKNRQIQNLNEQINKANIKIKNCQQKIGNMVLSSRKMEQNNRSQIQRRSQSLSPTHYTTSYTQLQMKLCSLLGIYLTANTQKILAPIEQLLKNKSQMETNNRNYQQLLKIFDTKQSTRLVLQMTECRTTYHRFKQISQIQHNEILALRQQKAIMEDRIQYLSTMYKKLQVITEDSNEKVMRLRFKSHNQKYNFNGLKKY